MLFTISGSCKLDSFFLKMLRLILLFIIPFVNCDRVIQTNSGPVAGIPLDVKDPGRLEPVEAYLGIPYAEPPVGDLRFQRPVPKSPWKETLNANELPPACVQGMTEHLAKLFNDTSEMREDCLFLNLWVPQYESSSLKPVMVFIHGGGFMTGSSNLFIYDGAALAHRGNVIVASINYRVGTLGFFSAFIDEASGSMGMYDQVLAIQWIKDNAKHFGGDPDNIVLFGESAGAFSIGLHLVSPLSKNLFSKAILQSGSAISPMYSDNKVLRMGCQAISKLVGCADNDNELEENPKKVVECMKNLPSEKFPQADAVLTEKLAMLLPRVGDEFLPENPTDLYRKGEFKNAAVLLGTTRDEGSIFVALQKGLRNGDLFGKTIDIRNFTETEARGMIKAFSNEEITVNYFAKALYESRYTYLDAISDVIGDALITCGVVFQADFQSLKCPPVYFYLFDYRSPTSIFPEWVGVPHFDEVQYVFGNPFLKTFSDFEKELSRDMMDMWVAFAKKGNPSIPGGLKWPKYTHKDPKFFIIGKRDKIGVKPDNFRCEAWRSLYNSTIDEDIF